MKGTMFMLEVFRATMNEVLATFADGEMEVSEDIVIGVFFGVTGALWYSDQIESEDLDMLLDVLAEIIGKNTNDIGRKVLKNLA